MAMRRGGKLRDALVVTGLLLACGAVLVTSGVRTFVLPLLGPLGAGGRMAEAGAAGRGAGMAPLGPFAAPLSSGATLVQTAVLVGLAAGVARALRAGQVPAIGRPSMMVTIARRAEATDTVTGTKFEEKDEAKNPEKRPGHQVKGMGDVDPETAARQARVREHQQNCPRLTWPEEIRTIMAQRKGFATISTVAQKESIQGFPTGSVVGFSTDERGRPIFSFSGMSSHTKNLLADPRASLCVTEPDFRGAADARVVLTGKITPVPKEDLDAVQEQYLQKHEGAYWVKFGDFTMFRMDEILDITFVGGFARAGVVTPAEYMEAAVDPCLAFSEPVMKHMNDDHESSIQGYIEHLVGAGPCDGAKMKRLDRYGFDVRVKQGSGEGVLRVPFPEPVTERSKIKVAIVALSKQVAAAQEAAAATATPAAEA